LLLTLKVPALLMRGTEMVVVGLLMLTMPEA